MKLNAWNSLSSFVRQLAKRPHTVLRLSRNNAFDLELADSVRARYGELAALPVMPVEALVPGLDETLAYYTFGSGSSLPLEQAVMKALSRTRPNFRFLEIGVFLGEASANVSDTGAEAVALSLGEDDLRRFGLTNYIAANRFFIRNKAGVRNIDANSYTYDFAQLGTFDLVFIDGDHSYEGVLNDTRKVLAHCMKPDTVVFWHDYAQKATIRHSVLAGLLDGVPPSMHDRLYYLENTYSAVLLPEGWPKPPRRSFDPTATPSMSYEMRVAARKV